MQLKQLAIRELIKESTETPAKIAERGGIISVSDPMAQQLFDALLASFNRRSSLTHGAFNQENEGNYPFISAFKAFVKSTWDEQSFAQLCDHSMRQLLLAINNPSAHTAYGGYVLFALYANDRHDFMLTALARDKSSIVLDNNLRPTEVMEVNLSQLHQAMRINISTFNKQQDSYLSFIGSKEKGEITHYFSSAFGCTDVTPSKKSTAELIRAARDFCSQNSLAESKEAVVDDVVNYLEQQKAQREPANLKDIENLFDSYIPPEQAETIAGTFGKFANTGPYKVSQEFQPHTSTINRYAKVRVKDQDWNLELLKRGFGPLGSKQNIEFDKDNGRLIINHLSERVINQLKEILEHET